MEVDISHYSYQGVMAWMEDEWRKFHREREEWANEKALLCATVDQLKRLLRVAQAGEASSSRRIKALEAQVLQQNGGRPAPDDANSPLSDTGEGGSPQDLHPGITSLQIPAVKTEITGRKPAGPVPTSQSDKALRLVVSNDRLKRLRDDQSDGSSEVSDVPAAQAAWAESSTNSQIGSPAAGGPASPQAGGETAGARKKDGRRMKVPPIGTSGDPDLPPEEVGPPSPQAASQTPISAIATGYQNAKAWELRASLRGHFAAVRCACWCGDGMLMLTGGDDHVVRLWDARRVLKGKDRNNREEPIVTFRGHTSAVLAVRAHKDDVVAAARDGCIRVWKVPHNRDSDDKQQSSLNGGLAVLTEHKDSVWGISLLASEPELTFASVGADGRMLVWKRRPGEGGAVVLDTRFAATSAMNGGSFSPISCHLAATRFTVTYTNQRDASVTGIAVYSRHASLLWHRTLSARPTSLAINPSGKLGGIGFIDGKLELFDAADGTITSTATQHASLISSVDFAQDVVFTASHDGRVLALAVDNPSQIVQQLPSPHTKRLGECVHVVLYHTGRGIVVTTGADSSIAWYTSSPAK
ncbi:Striatin-like protein [Diplonema papillatum]|nr:Striatin-like protein [Diplonema papillatum]KAJ9471491.1 Striatin-like protein [Diplonema papillatum]